MRRLLVLPLLLIGCGTPETASVEALTPSPEQIAYDNALRLADRSGHVFEAVKPPTVRAIADLVSLSKVRPLAAPEKLRLSRLNDLRKLTDGWVGVHNAYLDILGAIAYFQEKSTRDDRDEARLAQLLKGLPRNNRNLEDTMERVLLACRELNLKVEVF